MTDLDAEVILALADNGLNITQAANSIYRHRNTVVYHVNAIKRETSLNPTDFWDMQKLVPMAQGILQKGEETE